MTDDLSEALNLFSTYQIGKEGPNISLTADSRSRVLKWYSGNPYDTRDEVIVKALDVLHWCQENSGVFQCPLQLRRAIIEEASATFGLPVKKITDLMVESTDLLNPRETTRLIAFEGIDGAGKTYQLRLLQQFLLSLGANATVVSCPDYREFFGRELANLLSGNEHVRADQIDPKSMALWYALDRKKSLDQIRNEPPNGFLLLNRYTLSSVVYQSARAEVDLADWIFELEHTHLAIPAPDLYIVFDVSPGVSQANVSDRRRKDGTVSGLDVYEKSIPLLNAARQSYRVLAERLPGIELIECMADEGRMKSPHQIHTEVVSCLDRHHLLTTIASQTNSQ